MEINQNFLAKAGWGLVAAGGQALTMQIRSAVNGMGKHTHYADVVLNREMAMQMAVLGNANGLKGISPAIDFTPRGAEDSKNAVCDPVGVFLNFLANNTAHVSKLNFRAPSAETLPTSVLILTPNVFTGQMDRQVLNVTADTTMYQQQSNIVTINHVDVYLGRDSVIRFAGNFDENAERILNLDVTIDRYISVERALLENLQLLATQSGQVLEAMQVINAEVAKTDPNVITEQAAMEVTNTQIGKVINPVQWANQKGWNSKGNR